VKSYVFVFLGLWLTVAFVVFAAPGCYGRNCEGELETFGVDAGQGEMVSPTQWESTPTVGPWLSFPRQRAYVFDIRALGGRTPYDWNVFLSAASQPNVGGPNAGNQTTGAGNIALVQNIGPNRIDVFNDTCSDYYMRLVVTVPPLPPFPGDGGAPVVDVDAGDDDDDDGGSP